MSTLWMKKKKSLPLIESFLAGDDTTTDLVLLPYDIQGSVAHAKGLRKIGVLSAKEERALTRELGRIFTLWRAGKIKISPSEEDCHTVIENLLVKRLGVVGKKIHTGRSRNDQVLVALRLYMKNEVAAIEKEIFSLIRAFEKKARAYKDIPMPGYTHMQRAMPSSVDAWLLSFRDALLDDLVFLASIKKIIDQNPLGSVAGYGETTLGLDREVTTKLLGFKQTQKNPLYCALSRGKFELMLLQALSAALFDIGKFATDALLFSTKEFGFLSLPDSFTTGSSVMPQKRNYDVLELLRAHVSAFNGTLVSLQALTDKLPSGYNRDFQLTKKPFIEGVHITHEVIEVTTLVVKNLKLNSEALKAACTEELYATEETYRLVKEKGIPFRDAYRIVAKKFSGRS
ncbi:MAG TPA: argininosuccinate lyase [Candidatus Paceibacterota bacterium]